MFPTRILIAVKSLLLLGLVGTAAWLKAATVTIGPAGDTTLFQFAPENNLGAELTMISGTTANGMTNRALLKFDVAGNLPANATIQSVSLNVTVVKNSVFGPPPTGYSLHRVLAGWGEGTGIGANKGAPAANGEATWLARSHPNVLWSAPGATAPGDFVDAASASQTIEAEGSYNFDSTSTLVADTQSWLANPGSNYGWILICGDEATIGSSRRFASREDEANAPYLVIEYTTPVPPHVTMTPVSDTSLFELTPDNNLGTSSLVAGTLGPSGGQTRTRALMQFSTQDIPPDAVLTSATLTMNVVMVSAGQAASNFDLHRVLRPWGEGDKSGARGTAATAGEATWNERFFPSTPWGAPGGAASVDFAAAVSSTAFISQAGPYAFSNLLADVQFWVAHPDQNYGWMLVTESESVPYTGRRFGSREDANNTPTLEVKYIPRPSVVRREVAGGQFTLSFTAQAGLAYAVQTNDALVSAGGWSTLTNFPAASTPQTVVVTAPAAGSQRFYRISAQ